MEILFPLHSNINVELPATHRRISGTVIGYIGNRLLVQIVNFIIIVSLNFRMFRGEPYYRYVGRYSELEDSEPLVNWKKEGF